MLENLPDLRKGLRKMMKLEKANEWAEAQHFYKRVFVPSLDIVAERMGLTRQEVRNLL